MIGPSGCGKTTLLRVLNRLYDMYPDERVTGEALVDGSSILGPEVDVNLLRWRIGMVFQGPTPFPMSIFENVALGPRDIENLSRQDTAERVEESLTRAALWSEVKDRLSAQAGSLSVGQQQRLCIARTLAARPEVILFDEPTSALDPISGQKIEALIADLEARSHHSHRDAQHGAGAALRRQCGVLLPWRDDRGGLGRADVRCAAA